MAIRIANPGFFTTVQDLGRYGYAHLGVSPAGAADDLSFRIANLLVGNEENMPALEMTLLGATLEFEERAIVAVTGAESECKLGADAVSQWQPFEVNAGSALKCGTMIRGVRSYLAVQGGLDVRPAMGSAATHFGSRLGGVEGRGLKTGDLLQIGHITAKDVRWLPPGAVDGLMENKTIRVTKGPQQEWFTPDAIEKFFSCDYLVTPYSDRSGLRLSGEAVQTLEKRQLLTEGISLGSIQVPQDGQPIILFRDQQTTGGYPKIANVIAADLRRVGQLRPGDKVRFCEVSIRDGVELLRKQEQWLKETLAGES